MNRKDSEGNNVFQGGFLGLDNVGVFDRSGVLPNGGVIEQSDATSWMGMYCLNMMTIALELSRENPAYEDVASKFLEHFVYISRAMNNIAGQGIELWDRTDRFYYDVLRLPDGKFQPMRVRSLVGLIPLFAVETLDSELIDTLPGFKRRMQYFIDNLPEFADCVETLTTPTNIRRFLSLVSRDRLARYSSSCWTNRSFSRRTESVRSPATIAIIPTRCGSTGMSTESTISRRSRKPGSSAAIRTGEARSGSRSTS